MSYLTGRCEVCEGTARIHKGQETECTKTPDCSGCARCRDCIDGKVVSLPGAKRSATIGKGTPARINTVRQQNRQASATFFRSPTTTAATDVADIYAAYGSPEPGSPGLPAHELPLAPVLNRKRTLIEEAVAILERGDVDDADPSQDSQQPPMLAPSRSSSMNRLSSPEPRVPASLMALFDTMPEESVLPSESVIPTESAQPRSSTAVRRSSSMGPRSRQLSVVATIAESPQSRETTEALPTTSEQEGAQVQHPVRLSTSVRSIIEKEAVLSPVLSSPTLGEPNTKFIPDLRGATSVGDMSAKQSPVPGESPKTEKRKGLGIFGKKKKSETPMATIPQSLHGQSQIPPSPESRDRAKTSEPTSTKGLFSRMRKTSSFGKIPDPTKVAPEALVPEEKISTEFISGGTEEVTVEGQGGGGPPYPTVTHRRAVAGPRIQTIVHDLHEDVVQPRPTGRQYDSIDLLNDRAVARTTKPLFEDGVELRDKSKSVDNLLQSDKKGRLASDIFSFAKKKKSFAADSNMSASTSSLAPSLAVETTLPRPAVSSPQGTSPMHALSGGVAIRKSKKPLCVTIRTPQSGGQPDTDPSPQSVASTPAKEHRRTPSRNFKDWYTKYANDAVKQRLEEMSEERTFPDPITLDFIFGSKLSGPKDAVHSFAKASRCYETSRKDPLWDVRGNNEAPGTHKGRDTVHLELVDDIAYKYRPLDIFHDGKLKGVSYSQAVHGPVLDIIVDGRRDDLLDALIFPLEQDMSYAEVFLATFRFYMPSDLLMDSLIEWYNVDIDPEIASAPLTSAIDPSGTDSLADISPGTAPQTDAAYHRPQHESFLKKHRKHIQSRVVRVLMMWVKNHWHDFQEDAALFKMLQAFVDHIASIGFGDGQKLSQAVREQRLSWYTTQYIPAFPPKRNHQLDNTKPWALVWEPEDFAKDLTYIDHFLFRQIRPDAYLHVLARPVEKEGAGRNVPLKVLLEYITWFRLVGSYTASTVLLEELPKKRARAIKHMIKIAKNCRDLRNYNTLFAILWGLKRPAIAKDHQAWEAVSTKHVDIFMSLAALMDPADGNASYWAEFEKARPPAIPFLGAYMRDMLEIHQDAPMYLDAQSPAGQGINMSTKPRRKGGRARNPTGEPSSADERSPTPPPPLPSSDTTGESPSSSSPTTQPTIHFQKYYDLYAVAAELEMFRVGSAMYPPLVEKDQGALLLTHMRDMAIKKDSGEWLDDILAEKAGLSNNTGFLQKGHSVAVVNANISNSNSTIANNSSTGPPRVSPRKLESPLSPVDITKLTGHPTPTDPAPASTDPPPANDSQAEAV